MEGKHENPDSGTARVPPPPPPLPVIGGGGNFSGSTTAPAGLMTPGSDGSKKKRGRPRKYGPDGKPAVTLSPMPISASIPLAGDLSGWKHNQEKPVSSVKKRQKLDFGSPGEQVAFAFGTNFTPHVIIVTSGEDVNMKIISFAQQGSRALCILSANGTISNVTLRQPDSSGGTLTYEGRFDILSLSGAFMPSDIGGAKGRSGGMSVSLAGPDGRVLGGGLAGMLIAASPVQVVVGSFVPDNQQQKPKSRFENVLTICPPPIAAPTLIFKEAADRGYRSETTISFTPTNPIYGSRNEKNGSFHGSEPKEVKTSQFQISY